MSRTQPTRRSRLRSPQPAVRALADWPDARAVEPLAWILQNNANKTQRTLARGAWIAPANEYLQGVVALTPAIDRSRWLDLQDAQLNLIRHEPRGFTAMNSDTLSTDDDLRLINVRRLLILLRRLALRLGATYVFEPNSDAFRRSVQRGFEAMLDGMFLRGAFAGATAATSYQVVTDTSVNTAQSVDQGRFIVELRVAPSLPLTFLTIRLVQTGDRTLVTQET